MKISEGLKAGIVGVTIAGLIAICVLTQPIHPCETALLQPTDITTKFLFGFVFVISNIKLWRWSYE